MVNIFSKYKLGSSKRMSGDNQIGLPKNNANFTVTVARPPASREDPLAQLKNYDTVVVMDDSGSMTEDFPSRWSQASEALQNLAAVAVRYDSDGIDVHFLNSRRNCLSCKSSSEVIRLFREVQPRGLTPLGLKLGILFGRYVDDYKKNPRKKPVNFIIVTDGIPDDRSEVVQVIVSSAQRLHELNAKSRQMGIQFVQVGSDAGAAKFLKSLDDDLMKSNDLDRDMVDTIPSKQGEKLDLIKALLGAINAKEDNKDQ